MDYKGVWRVRVRYGLDAVTTITVHAYSEAEARRHAKRRAETAYGVQGALPLTAERVRDDR